MSFDIRYATREDWKKRYVLLLDNHKKLLLDNAERKEENENLILENYGLRQMYVKRVGRIW